MKRGRHTVEPGEPSTAVHVTVSVDLYDRTYAIAVRERVTVPEVIRRALAEQLKTENRQTPRTR